MIRLVQLTVIFQSVSSCPMSFKIKSVTTLSAPLLIWYLLTVLIMGDRYRGPRARAFCLLLTLKGNQFWRAKSYVRVVAKTQ